MAAPVGGITWRHQLRGKITVKSAAPLMKEIMTKFAAVPIRKDCDQVGDDSDDDARHDEIF